MYFVVNPIQTLIIRCHIVLLGWFIERAWAACDNTSATMIKLLPLKFFNVLDVQVIYLFLLSFFSFFHASHFLTLHYVRITGVG